MTTYTIECDHLALHAIREHEFLMVDFVRPASVDTPTAIAVLLPQRFAEVVELEVATSIAHPFLPGIPGSPQRSSQTARTAVPRE